jgi:hypothetical protein
MYLRTLCRLMPSARATIRIEWPSFKRLLICDCIRELILSVAMTGTSVAAGISARRFLLRWSSSDSTELTTSKRVVNFDPNAWSTHHQTGVVNLRSNWVVNFVAKGWSTSDPIGHVWRHPAKVAPHPLSRFDEGRKLLIRHELADLR